MSIVWTNEVVIKLIDVYKDFRLLWDSSCVYYKNKAKKRESWEEIARVMGLPRKEVESKVHTLRSQFSRERKRISMSRAGSIVLKSNWFAYQSMLFLLNVGLITDSESTDMQNPPQEGDDGSWETMNIEYNSDRINTKNSESPPPLLHYSDPQSKRPNHYDSPDDEVVSSKKRKDDLGVFMQYVNSELTSVEDEHSTLVAKYHINRIVTNARMGKYEQQRNEQVTEPCRSSTEISMDRHSRGTADVATSSHNIKTEELYIDDSSLHSWKENEATEERERLATSCSPMLYDALTNSKTIIKTENDTEDRESTSQDNEHSSAAAGVSKHALETIGSEFDIFGRGVAAQLKGMPLRNALQLQLIIQQLITEHRLNIIANRSPAEQPES